MHICSYLQLFAVKNLWNCSHAASRHVFLVRPQAIPVSTVLFTRPLPSSEAHGRLGRESLVDLVDVDVLDLQTSLTDS